LKIPKRNQNIAAATIPYFPNLKNPQRHPMFKKKRESISNKFTSRNQEQRINEIILSKFSKDMAHNSKEAQRHQ
ncbi:16999_t:CDS:2, partial [Racocetra persica]